MRAHFQKGITGFGIAKIIYGQRRKIAQFTK
jgi:hypothetical protein